MKKKIEEQLINCVKCGTCRSVCPAFNESKIEIDVARGKLSLIRLILDGDVEVSRRGVSILEKCLLCGACAENCPSEVKVDELIIAARGHLKEELGMPVVEKLITGFGLSNLEKGVKTAKFFEKLLFKKVPETSGLHIRFKNRYLKEERLIPPLADKFFLDEAKERNNGRSNLKVAFFTGCFINYLQPEIGKALIKVLSHYDVNLFIPKNQLCCGLPAMGSGNLKSARELAEKNMEIFKGFNPDYIVVACASCGETLKKYYRSFFLDLKNTEIFSSKVIDISELLVDVLKVQKSMKGISRVISTYHTPCHLKRGLGGEEQAVSLLSSATEFRKPSESVCCGLGGSFSLKFSEDSKKIQKRNVESLLSSSPEVIVTSCPGCMMQIRDGFYRGRSKVKVKHLLEIVAESM